MLEGLINVAWAGVYSGGSFGDLLYQWEQMGMFAYILPFLLIFALVYGILERVNIFGTKDAQGKKVSANGINAIIAIVVGLMALQFQMVSVFFSEIFPRLGIGISVILVILILVGMFMPKKTFTTIGMLIIAAIVAIIVIGKSFDWTGWSNSTGWWSYNGGAVLGVIFVLVVLGIAFGPKSSEEPESVFSSVLEKAMR